MLLIPSLDEFVNELLLSDVDFNLSSNSIYFFLSSIYRKICLNDKSITPFMNVSIKCLHTHKMILKNTKKK